MVRAGYTAAGVLHDNRQPIRVHLAHEHLHAAAERTSADGHAMVDVCAGIIWRDTAAEVWTGHRRCVAAASTRIAGVMRPNLCVPVRRKCCGDPWRGGTTAHEIQVRQV